MKPFFAAVLILSLPLMVRAEDDAADKPAADLAPKVEAVAVTPPSAPSVPEKKAPLVFEMSPIPEAPKAEAPKKEEPVAVPAPAAVLSPSPVSVGCVAPLQDLVVFHEKEIVALNQMITRWDAKVRTTMKRRQDLEQEVQAKVRKSDELLALDTKTSKRDADRLKKDVARINKDILSVDKEQKSQCKELAGEIREVSRDSQLALKDFCQQAITDIQKP